MANPGMFGMNQQMMEQAKEVGRHIKMEVTKYRRQGTIEVQFLLVDPNENYDFTQVVDSFTAQLIWGFANVFDIKGRVIEKE